jgi:hypothetical protein
VITESKRHHSPTLAVAVLLGLGLPIAASASGTLQLGNVAARPGGDALIPVLLTGTAANKSLIAFQPSVPSGFSAPAVLPGTDQSNLAAGDVFRDEIAPGVHRVTALVRSTPNLAAGAGQFALLRYSIPANQAEGVVAVTAASAQTFGVDRVEQSPAIVAGQILVDGTAPTSTASADGTQADGTINGTYSSSDAGSGVSSVALYAKEPGGNWTLVGPVTGGAWSYTPLLSGDAADGTYRFATVATDAARNVQVIPTGSDLGDVAVTYNNLSGSGFTVTYTGNGTGAFPVSDTETVEITLAGVTAPVGITVTRLLGDVGPPGFITNRLIDERLVISGALNGATATITWDYAAASLNPPTFTGPLNTVFQFSGTTQTGQYNITPSGGVLTIGPVTGFSTWYAGANDASVPNWSTLDE